MSIATAQLLLVVAAKVTVVFGVSALIDIGVLRRRGSAAARHMLWSVAVVASLLVPILGASSHRSTCR